MPYFNISAGLRGCYLDDSAYVIQAATRRELKARIEAEAAEWKNAGYIGANQKAIATIAAAAWRDRKKTQLPYALPLAPSHSPKNYAFGVFVSSATRDEWKEYRLVRHHLIYYQVLICAPSLQHLNSDASLLSHHQKLLQRY